MKRLVWKVSFEENRVGLEDVILSPAPKSLNEITKNLPDGAYTTFRTYHGRKTLNLTRQIQRLETTAAFVCCPVTIGEREFRSALQMAMQRFGSTGELRFRINIDLEIEVGRLYIALETLRPPAEADYVNGVDVVTRLFNRKNPKAKLTDFISIADQIRCDLPPGIHEALLVDEEGRLLEGLSSNFFAVKERKIWTEEEAVLSGITREMVLDEARKSGIVIVYQPVHAVHIPDLDEAFITSASRGVLPVRSIDGIVVGSGKPGEVTQELARRYEARILLEAENI